MYQPKISKTWFLENPRYLVYFLRELTGVIIAFYVGYFTIAPFFYGTFYFLESTTFRVISIVTLIASLFHTFTWFWTMSKLAGRKIFFVILLIVWIAISWVFLEPLAVSIFK